MEKNNHPNYSSSCSKIRQALSNSSAVRAIHRISHYHHRESSSSKPSGSPLPQPQHVKGINNNEGNGAIPIQFDYSNPTSNGHGQVGKVATKIETEPPRHASVSAAAAGEGKGKSKAQDFEQQYDKKDVNYIFGEYIERARAKFIRTMSNFGKAQSKPPPDEASVSVAKRMDTHRDRISDYIYHTKKKIRATSSIRFGKHESLKRG